MINENININIEGVYNPWNPEHIINFKLNAPIGAMRSRHLYPIILIKLIILSIYKDYI